MNIWKVWVYESEAGELMLFSKKPEFNSVTNFMKTYHEMGFIDLTIELVKKTVKKEFTFGSVGDFSVHFPSDAKNIKLTYEVEE